MFDPNLNESDCNAKPTSLGSGRRIQEPWVGRAVLDPRHLGLAWPPDQR